MKSDRSGDAQYAALPWRRSGSGLSILLLTSRETKRWVIPKGWPMPEMSASETAAQEAFEEGGVRGLVDEAIGTYRYDKRLKDGSFRSLSVEVFPLEVRQELEEWPEAAERARRWFSPDEAADAVDEAELSALIRRFSEPSAPPRT